jgi:hypothetical protein
MKSQFMGTRFYKRRACALLFAVTTLFLTEVSAQTGQTFTWTGAVSTDWHNPSNWRPAGVPNSVDTVIVGSKAIVQTNANVTVSLLYAYPGSSITGNGSISLIGGGSFNDVRIGGPGNLIISSGATLSIYSSGTYNGTISGTTAAINTRFEGYVYNYGTINWTAGNLLIAKGFRQYSSGRLNISGSGYIVCDPAFPTSADFYGTVRKTSVGATAFMLLVTNRGRFEAVGGNMDFRSGFQQYAGTTVLGRGTLSSPKPLQYSGGRLEGSGTVNASVDNLGATVAPGNSPGAMVINGSYIQAANGTLQAEIGGTTPVSQYDQLQVNGPATLDGTLEMVSWENFVPVVGNSFQLVKYLSLSGTPTIANRFNNGIYFSIQQTTSFLVAQTYADTGVPSIKMSAPFSNKYYSGLPSAYGTATDTTSGIASVTVRLYRYATPFTPEGFWNGSSWSSIYNPSIHELLATGTTNWSRSLPALAQGQYYIVATARDKANNAVSTAVTNFWMDKTPPSSVTISSPVHNTNVTNLNNVTGTANDSYSGIARVTLSIKRSTDNTYWNGSTWTAAVTNLSTTLAGSQWSRTHSAATPMPTGALLPTNVSYTLTATAYDRANLTRTISSTVTVIASGLQYQTESDQSSFQDSN